ncbi:MAG TPA: ABC transporter permease [Acetobacteraceae bacterium]|nr:ABC transporter permease [Acetobacteraceae bacterium]
MRRSTANIFWLGTKELRSFFRDYVLLGLVVYAFTIAVYAQASSTAQELHNAAVAIVDEDHSPLSRAIAADFLPPFFKPAQEIEAGETDRALDLARYGFVIDIPPHFERDMRAGRDPGLQVNIDATAAMQAGIGADYIQQILDAEIARFAARADQTVRDPVNLVMHVEYNPNTTTSWFTSVMAIIGNITMLAIVLAGAAIVREREHGTMDHLMVMPLRPFEIATAKIAANGLVITAASWFALSVVVRVFLGVPIVGSVPLFIVGVMLYLFFATAVGLFLGTIARSMPQLGLLFILVSVPLNMLSGSNTPLESMPPVLQVLMEFSPTTHFVSLAQAVLFRGAGIDVVWPDFLAVAGIGAVFFVAALARFRRVTAMEVT